MGGRATAHLARCELGVAPGLKRLQVLPPEARLAMYTRNVRNRVQPGHQDALLRRPEGHVRRGGKEVGTAMPPGEGLGDEELMSRHVGET